MTRRPAEWPADRPGAGRGRPTGRGAVRRSQRWRPRDGPGRRGPRSAGDGAVRHRRPRGAVGSPGDGPRSCRRPCRPRNRPAHRTAEPARAGRRSLLGPDGEVVEDHGRPTGTTTGPDDRGELRTPAQACLRGQHLRRRASRDPCGGDRRGSPGPRGCASAAGSRGSWTAGGCSAGTCACSRGTPTTRHRRCAPIGGRARGGIRRGQLTSRGPGFPRTLVPPDRHAHRTPRTGQGEQAEPATDSDQHSRGREVAGGRSDPDRPWSTRGHRGGWRRAATTPPSTRPTTRRSSPGTTRPSLPGCGWGC